MATTAVARFTDSSNKLSSKRERVGVQLDTAQFRKQYDRELRQIEKTRRVTNYLAAAQVYLQDNVLLKEPLKPEHIKERLLGHWGMSCRTNV